MHLEKASSCCCLKRAVLVKNACKRTCCLEYSWKGMSPTQSEIENVCKKHLEA